MEQDHAAACMDRIEADRLLTTINYPTSHEYLIASCVGQTLQALIYGSAFTMSYYYFFQSPRRDSPLARLGMVYLGFMCLAHMVLCNYQSSQVVVHSDRLAAVIFSDLWLFSLGSLIRLLIVVPILVFFSRRAYIIWNRNKAIFATCLLFDAIHLVGCLASGAEGLKAPWGLGPVSNDEFYRWAPTLGDQITKLRTMGKVAIFAKLVNVCVVSFLICYGIYRHRNGFREMDNAISKIVFICSESLFPVLLIVLVDVVGVSITFSPVAILLSRAAMQLAPPLYFYGLNLSLVSRERVAAILSAEPVRQLTPFESTATTTLVSSSDGRIKSRRSGGKRLGLFARQSHVSSETIHLDSREPHHGRAKDLPAEEASMRTISLLYSPPLNRTQETLGGTVSHEGPKTQGPPEMSYPPQGRVSTYGPALVTEEVPAKEYQQAAEEKPHAGVGDGDDQDSVYDFCDMLRSGPTASVGQRR